MNYQTFSHLQFWPLLKNFFRSIHDDFRDTSGEKKQFVSVGITHLVLMFRKASDILFYPRRRYQVVASIQVEILFWRSLGQ